MNNIRSYKLAQKDVIIDDSILNTSPQDPFDPQKVISPEKAIETFIETQTPKQNSQGNEVILDIDGNKSQVGGENMDSTYKSVQELVSPTNTAQKDSPPTNFLLVGAAIIGIFILVILNLKRSEHILKLEREINKLKQDNIYKS